MNTNDRQRLVSMVRGGSSGREPCFRLRFGTDAPSGTIFLDRDEIDKFGRDSENLFLLGCRPELREITLREHPCLVRQNDGRFVAVNPEKQGQIYLIE